jgi:hypothetical protein
MKLFILLFCIVSFHTAAQDPTVKKLREESNRAITKDPNDTIPKTWKTGGLFNLNLGQGSLTNWAAGGDEFTLTVNTLLNVYAFYKKEKWSWDNSFDVNFGYLRTTSLGGRKNDDRFDLLSKLGYALAPKLNLALLYNLRSQFLKGYSYSDNTKTLTSAFLSPGYFLHSLGLDYKPKTNLSIFVSPLTYRVVTVIHDSLYTKGLYGVKAGKKRADEFGAFLTANYLKEGKITYKGRLDLFSNYRNNPQNIDLFLSNLLAAKLGKIFSINYSLDLIYDDDVRLFGPNKTSAALQVKSIVGVGMLVKF